MKAHLRGVTLLELLTTISIVVLVTAISVVNILPAIRNAHVDSAHQQTVTRLRQARQAAIDERRVYIISFLLPGTIKIQRQEGGNLVDVSQFDLPSDIEYRAEPGIPTNVAQTPDNFGTGGNAVDFSVDYGGGANQVYFQPDGSGRDSRGRINNGVVYLARPGELLTARAVSLFGVTGRIKGWRLVRAAGNVAWR